MLIFVFTFLNTIAAFAGPSRTTYQAKIVKPDGYPLEASSVNFKFTILDPAGTCILYSETYSSVNMSGTGGLISFALGSGVKTYPASATTFEQVFSNITPSLSCDVGGPTDYTPSASDIRKIVMQFHDGSGWQTLPAMSINAVPYAMYANEAAKLNGLQASDFVQLSAVPTCAVSEALRYTGAGFTCVVVGNSVTSGTVATALGYTPADSASLTTVSSDLSTVSSTVAGVSVYASSVSSTVTSLQSSVAASFAAITSSQWTTSGTNIFYNTGNIGIGTTAPVTKLDVSGGVRIGTESTTCAPALAGTLRYNASNIEYCNGTTWQAFGVSGAGITNFNGSTSSTQSLAFGTGGTTPNIVTANGVHTLNIPLASTGAVTAGLLSNADYTTFSNKITSSAASIAQVLGYVPADNSVSGTYAQKANNLSDLTNVATARTNLGLGTFATASSIDLGGASATGTLAIARLPNFTGDATVAAASNTIILSNSGVTAGTYTKITVDAKGRVTSSSALSVSDVTTALGYTPASATASTQWTTSGSAIYYNTGNVGIGTGTPSEKLSVAGNLNLVNPGATINRYMNIAVNGGAEKAFIRFDQTASPGPSQYWDIGSLSASNIYDFGFESSGTRRMTLTFGGNLGVGTSAPITKLDVAGGVRISMESATCTVSYAGTLRYTGGNIEYCNGSAWAAFGVATVGVNTLNGSASQTQTFANGTAGTAPAFVTANGVHTLNIPLASAGSVTAGLISNADYTSFANKITSSAAAISQVLGYAPVSTTTLTNYVLKANNLSDLTNIATARTNLGLGTFATASTIDLGSASATGTMSAARMPELQGDVDSVSGSVMTTVTGLQGRSVASTAPASGQVLSYNGTSWAPATNTSSQWLTSGSTISYSSGNVGIGTAGPINLLHAHASAGNTVFRMSNASTGTTGGDGFVIQQTASDVNFINYETGAMAFQTSASERMRITSTGNVGIGTTAPTKKLHIADNTDSSSTFSATRSAVVKIANTYGSGNTVAGITFNHWAADQPLAMIGSLATSTAGNGGGDMVFGVKSGTGASDVTEYMRLQMGGNVGIGTSAPTSRLHLSDNNAVMLTVDRPNNQNSLIEYKNTLGSMYAGLISGSSNWGVGTSNDLATSGVFTVTNTGRVYIGGTAQPTARLHIAAGTSSLAPVKFTSGTLLSSPQSGTIEYDGVDFYITDGNNNRRTIATASTAGTLDNVTVVSSPSGIALWPAAGNSVTVSATTASTNSSTGALIVKGGMGIAGNLYSSGTIITSSNIQGASITATSGLIAPYIYGSTAASGDLYINSTTHATKGDLILMNQGGKVGIGTTTPGAWLHVSGTGTTGTWGSFSATSGGYVRVTESGSLNLNIDGNSIIADNSLSIATTGASAMQFGTSNTERIRIDSSGNVGIGTNSPTSLLHLYMAAANTLQMPLVLHNNDATDTGGSATSLGFRVANTAAAKGAVAFERTGSNGRGKLHFLVNNTNDTTTAASLTDARMTVDYSGNVGIGTDAPTATLDVVSALGSMNLTRSVSNATGPDIYLQKDRVGSAVVSGDNLGQISFRGYTGASYTRGARISSVVTSAPAVGQIGADLRFYTNNSGSDATERLRIDQSGNVGIGTSTPQGKLDVANATIRALDSATQYEPSSGRGLELLSLSGTGYIFPYDRTTSTYLPMRIDGSSVSIGNSGTTVVNVSGGGVGIGVTPSASYKLDVLGDIYVGNGGSAQKVQFRTANTDGGFIRFNSTADTPGGSSLEIGTIDNSDEPILFTQTANERMRIHTNGYVGIGTAAPTTHLAVNSTTASGYTIISNKNAAAGGQEWRWYSSSTGAPLGADSMCFGTGACVLSLYTSGNATLAGTLTQSSDVRLKRDISSIPSALDAVTKLEGVTYYWKDSAKDPNKQLGLIAQNVEKVFPEAVKTNAQGFKSVAYQNLIAPVIEAVKELFQRLLGVEATIKQQSQEIEMLKTKSSQLEEQNKALKDYLCEKDPNAKICK